MKPSKTLKKLIRLELSPETHHNLRVLAATRGQSMAALARWLVQQEIENNSREKPRKNTAKQK